MFDIAWSELFLILVVALIVVGPKDLPRLMRKVGQWAGRARAMADQFRRSFDDMARQAELDELRSEVNRLKAVTTQPMTDADYKALGIDLPELPKEPLPANPLASAIEDVGAAPPRTEPEAPAAAPGEATPPAGPAVDSAAPKVESPAGTA